jgi:hypothetical protein
MMLSWFVWIQIKRLLEEKDNAELKATSQANKIAELEATLVVQKSRVIRLSRHIEATAPKMVNIAKTAAKSSLAGAVRHITLTQTLNLTAMNMSKILKTAAVPGGKAARGGDAVSAQSSGGKTASDEILAWTNYMSKNAVGLHVKVDSGESILLDEYLPAMQPARSMESLKNGKQLARVVLCMITQLLSVSSMPVAPPPKPGRPPPRPSAHAPSAPAEPSGPPIPTSISLDQLQDLKENGNNAHGLVYLTFGLMTSYFHCPSFSLDGIVDGKVESIECLMHYLLLVWTVIPGHSLSKEEKSEHTKIQEKQASVLMELETICDTRCVGNTLKIAELTIPEREEPVAGEQKEDGGKKAGTPQKGKRPQEEPDIAHLIMAPYDDDTYTSVGDALEAYLSEGGAAERLSEALAELERGIRDVTDFTNSVYMKQKSAAASVQFTLNAIKQQSMHCTTQMLASSSSSAILVATNM